MLTHFCWHCYAPNKRGSGSCENCGEDIAAPEGTPFDDRLIWALHHPIPERRMIAVHAIGRRRVVRAREDLRDLVTQAADPYLAAAALEALVQLDGAKAHLTLLDKLARAGPAPVRHAARELTSGR